MVFASGLLHVDSIEEGRVLRQRWSGRANALKPTDALDGYLAPVIERARAGGLTIEHHFEKLEYFNSSFISWIIHHLKRDKGAADEADALRHAHDRHAHPRGKGSGHKAPAHHGHDQAPHGKREPKGRSRRRRTSLQAAG